jgi:tetratricopeptide (TPR) repeat protein
VLEAEANSLINVGIDLTLAGEHEETISAFHQVREIFERDAWFRWRYNIRLHAAMADHALKVGDTAKAREIIERLRKTATKNEVHKYVAVSHQLMARVLIAEGDLTAAEAEYAAALDELQRNPVTATQMEDCAELAGWKLTRRCRKCAETFCLRAEHHRRDRDERYRRKPARNVS